MPLAASNPCHNISPENYKQEMKEGDDEAISFQKTDEKYRDLIPTLPKEKGWMVEHLLQYNGYWFSPSTSALKGAIFLQHHFKPRPTDVLLATSPKTGTTWLKALIFATMNRANFELSNHPLLTTGPHGLVPFFDFIFQDDDSISSHRALPSPRLFATHFPYSLLPEIVTTSSSGCRFVYICRNPKDVLVSKWLFMSKSRPKELPNLSLEEAFELFCRGVSHFGPYWDHVLGYWKASLESPNKVLFLKYEDMKNDPVVHVRRLAEFIGKPFSAEEERNGAVEEIIRLCSFENLSNLEVNKGGMQKFSPEIAVDKSNFFRKGQVGDWKNYLTEEMAKRIDQISDEKLLGSGLRFGT
ncbi:hypothetical protein FNV43_RR20785 [Rhamnella rubrinervis]|uniref:Sulfotransferase n=1 Tax=Rhamnella rubrinervis TaxID=2594499 RepID=A0A8K0E1D9_9ROSA|nr:hypothetical protein FNV43_RR20785 [Rhamnella rubrinervis]